MYGYVYLTTNMVNGKIYVGQHTAPTFEPERYIGSGLALLRAIEKYGKENFQNQLLCECFSKEELNQKEIEYISFYNSTDPKIGYNMSNGGDKNNVGTITITNDIEERHVLPEHLSYWKKQGFHVGRNMNTYINGMQGKTQSGHQKQIVSKANSYKRTSEQRANFSRSKKVPGKFICIRTPNNKSTVRCLAENLNKYLDAGYILANNKGF